MAASIPTLRDWIRQWRVRDTPCPVALAIHLPGDLFLHDRKETVDSRVNPHALQSLSIDSSDNEFLRPVSFHTIGNPIRSLPEGCNARLVRFIGCLYPSNFAVVVDKTSASWSGIDGELAAKGT